MWPPAVIVRGPIPGREPLAGRPDNNHLQMAFVEWNQEVETFATQTAAEPLAHRVRLGGPHRRPQNPYTQIGKTLVDMMRSRSWMTKRLRMIARLPGVAAASIPPWDGP